MQRASDTLDNLAPHMAADRHTNTACKHPECDVLTTNDWCGRHYHAELHTFLVWARHVDPDVAVSLDRHTWHLDDCPHVTKTIPREDAGKGHVCGHCRQRLETAVRGTLMGDQLALLRHAGRELGLQTALCPGGARLHLEGCTHLPADRDRWRSVVDQGTRQADEPCERCLKRARRQGAFTLLDHADEARGGK